ncbi:MAG: Na-K-Cl cotransporter [Chlamydiota bacterium]|jgi:amino acid transporter
MKSSRKTRTTESSEASKSEEEESVNVDPSQQLTDAENIQEQVEKQEKTRKKLGTFTGVFVPTLLTILGVILFLREGWVVGNAGYWGATLIIVLAFLITTCTAISMSSFVTNTRVGGGGAFAIVSQALGLEIGGSIGIPLLISQGLAVCMYIFGFRAGWLWIFPDHPAILVDLSTIAVIFILNLISTAFAFRTQYLILAIIIASLASIGMAALSGSMEYPLYHWGEFLGEKETGFKGIGFWGVFAVFFPASTGIMAGANMSADLKTPKKSIPVGTLSAIAVSFIVYLGVAYWLARSATVEELLNDYTVLIDKAYYSPAVLAGLLAATFSSALSSFVGASRILEALGNHNIIPFGKWLATRTKRGEPLYATIVTLGFTICFIFLRNLNIVAPLITMVFLIAYNVINLVVLIEESLGLISFRPLFRVHKSIPLLGFIGSIFAMFIISPIFGLVAVSFISAIYVYLMKRKLKAPFSDVRSGLFEAIAEWSAKKVKLLHGHADRAWKPNFLLPLDNVEQLMGVYRLVHHLAFPVGSVKLLGIKKKEDLRSFENELENSSANYLKHGVFSSFSVMEEEKFSQGVIRGIQALRGSFFRPNIVFLELPKDESLHQNLFEIVDTANYSKMGVSLIVYHPQTGLRKEEVINLWISKPKKWELEMKLGNIDLAILLSYRLKISWQGTLRIFMSVKDKKEKAKAIKYLERIISLARLPCDQMEVYVDQDFFNSVKKAPYSDLTVLTLESIRNVQFLWDAREAANATCLFCQDGGGENAFA